jgi:hypothetical protein
MAFRGIYPAPDLTPAPCGILSVARVMTHGSADYDERWVRGFSYEFDSQPEVQLFTVNDVDTGETGKTGTSTLPQFKEYDPFYIQVTDTRSAFGLTGEDRFAIAKKQLEAATQKALEHEFWEGHAARAETNGNDFLKKAAGATVVNSGALAPATALMLLEEALTDSPTGTNGVIHMTRDVASILGSRLIYSPADGGKTGKAMTRLGTEVVIGSGYTGAGRIGDANTSASASNKWMYATGALDVHLSKPEVVNENLGQGFTVSTNTNDLTVKAVRAAAVYFDPSIHYTVRLALPTT